MILGCGFPNFEILYGNHENSDTKIYILHFTPSKVSV